MTSRDALDVNRLADASRCILRTRDRAMPNHKKVKAERDRAAAAAERHRREREARASVEERQRRMTEMLRERGGRTVLDRESGRSFTVGGAGVSGASGAEMALNLLRMRLQAEGGREPSLVFQDAPRDRDEDDEDELMRNQLGISQDAATRYEVGDEVDFIRDGRALGPPYESERPGESYWMRGIIIKKWALAKEFDNLHRLPLREVPPVFPYAVRVLDEDGEHGEVWPVLRDDPDHCRATAAKYQTGYEGLRFKVGDAVECAIGPNEWMRGTVRELHKPYPAWGHGWYADGKSIAGATKDTVPYFVTPHGKELHGAYEYEDIIMVPADNDGYVRAAR